MLRSKDVLNISHCMLYCSGVAMLMSPGADHKMVLFPLLTFAYNNIKWEKIMHYAYYDSKQTLALRQASEESACFLLSFFCDD